LLGISFLLVIMALFKWLIFFYEFKDEDLITFLIIDFLYVSVSILS